MRLFALCLVTISLAACGRFDRVFQRIEPGSTTDVTFVQPRVQRANGEILPASVLNGGVMIYAVNVNQAQRRGAKYLVSEADQVSWTIPTASYVFMGIGYEGSNLSNGSPMHCGVTPPIALNGAPQTIQLILDGNNCGSPPFTAPGMNNGNQPPTLYLAACSNTSTVSTIGSACGTTTTWASLSAKVSLPEYNWFNGELLVDSAPGSSPNVESACVAPTGTPVTTSAMVPTGTAPPGDPFVIGINTFDTVGCTGYAVKRLYGLGRSLFNSGNPMFNKFEVNGAPFFPSPYPITAGNSGSNFFVYLRDLQ